eukprot:jgi/Tetstr1/449994/TSEL_037046.t1
MAKVAGPSIRTTAPGGVAAGRVEKRRTHRPAVAHPATGGNDDAALVLGNVVAVGGEAAAAAVGGAGPQEDATCANGVTSVAVHYTALPRASKERLEAMLFQWLDWHSEQQTQAESATAERLSGELEVFGGNGGVGGLRVWADRPRCRQVLSGGASGSVETTFDYEARFKVPQYDRACVSLTALAAGSSSQPTKQGNRCFNCGSYGHAMNKCTQARDRDRITSSRQAAGFSTGGPNTPSRYFLASAASEFADVVPGELSAETRAALGIGAADPPPWLPRMRLLGLPPGWSGNAAARRAAGGEEDFVIFDGEGEAAQTVPMTEGGSNGASISIRLAGINAEVPAGTAVEVARWADALARHPGSEDVQFHRKFRELQASIAAATAEEGRAGEGVAAGVAPSPPGGQPGPPLARSHSAPGAPRKFF